MTDQLLYIYCYANGVKTNNVVKKGDAVDIRVFYSTDINLGNLRVSLQVTGGSEIATGLLPREPGVWEISFKWTETRDPGTYNLTTKLYSVDVEGEMLVDTKTYTYTVQGVTPTTDRIDKIEQWVSGVKLNGTVKQGSLVQMKVTHTIVGTGGQYYVSLQRAGASEVKGVVKNRVAGSVYAIFEFTVDYPVGQYVFTARLYDIPTGGSETKVSELNFTQTVVTTIPPPPPTEIPQWAIYAGVGIAAVAIVAYALKHRGRH